MKMAKAPKDEWESVMRFAQELEDEIKYRNMTDEELGAWVRKAPCLFRVVFGYQVLVDNCADPNLDYLDFKPMVLPRCIERMERRREWIMEQKQRALECNDMLKAAGWGLRAAGVADAIDILKVVEEEARQNSKSSEAAGQKE